jgi:hypothetical protein
MIRFSCRQHGVTAEGTCCEMAVALSTTPAPPSRAVPDLLADAAETYRTRRAVYGPSERKSGDVLQALFPDGLTLTTADEWTRFGIFIQIVSKLCRYTHDFSKGHVDSIHDAGVYAFMLEREDTPC